MYYRNDTVQHNGMVRFFFLFNQERIIAYSPKAIAEITIANAYTFEKPMPTRRTLASVTGRGLVVTEGDEHRLQRRNMMPAFTFRHVKNLYPIFWNKTRQGVIAMTAAVQGHRQANLVVASWASKSTLDIIGMAAMGRDFSVVQGLDENGLFQKCTKVYDAQSVMSLFLLLGRFLPWWMVERFPIRCVREFRQGTRSIREVCHDLVKEKRARLLADKQKAKQDYQPEVDILSVALESGHLSDEGLADQLMTFLAAGLETTATSLTWAIYALCRHPEQQKRLRDEVRANLPSVDNEEGGAAVTSVDIDRLPYLNAVVNETLRLYPAIPLVARQAMHDTVVQGVPILRGTVITIPPWAVNVDRTLWGDDAAKFNPDRWITLRESDGVEVPNNTGGASNNYAFLTFLQGPRSCIGSSFARGELACLLAGWIGRFEFEFADKALMDEDKFIEVAAGVTIKPEDGLNVVARVVPGY